MAASTERLGMEVRDMIDRYVSYRYANAFLRDTDVKVLSRIVHEPHKMAYRITVECFPGFVTSYQDERKYEVSIYIDGNDAEQNRESHEWFMYQTQAIIPQLDSGIFSVWLATRDLAEGERRVYNDRVLPQVEQVRLINTNAEKHSVDFNSLAVIKMKNGCEWRETLDKIELDPTAFVAALLMVTP